MVKEALSSGKDQKELKRLNKFSHCTANSEKMKINSEKTPEGFTGGKKDYDQMFDQLLTPFYDEILVNSKGNVYDHLVSGLEKSLLSLTLKYCNHNQVRASQILGISRNTLRERIKRYDLW
jgi:DNA-binding protein Fis